jgi:hypothetical protein
MKFDDLKHRWELCDRNLDRLLSLNAPHVRSAIVEDDTAGSAASSDAEIDYTAPVTVFQKQRRKRYRYSMPQILVQALEELTGKLNLHPLRRRRTIRP